MNEKHKKVCMALHYFEHFLVFVFAVSSCVPISASASLFGVSVGLASSAAGLKLVQELPRLKNLSPLSRKTRRSKVIAKIKLNNIEDFVSKA